LKSWYINRFLKFREGAFTDPDSYFHNYAKLSKEGLALLVIIRLARSRVGRMFSLRFIRLISFQSEVAIMTKSANHSVNQVRLRK
jgi:type I pantothenate kinase